MSFVLNSWYVAEWSDEFTDGLIPLESTGASEGVAPVIVEQMVKVIRQLKLEGLTILLSEQNLHFAQAVSDRAVIIESGEQKFVGTLQELNAKPDIRDMYLAA